MINYITKEAIICVLSFANIVFAFGGQTVQRAEITEITAPAFSAVSVQQKETETEVELTVETKSVEIKQMGAEPVIEAMQNGAKPVSEVPPVAETNISETTPETTIKTEDKQQLSTVSVSAPEEVEIASKEASRSEIIVQMVLWKIHYAALLLNLLLIFCVCLKLRHSPQKRIKAFSFAKEYFFCLSSLLLLGFGLFIFVPWNVYFGNIDQFSFIFQDFVGGNLRILVNFVFWLLLVLLLVPSPKRDYCVCLIVGLGLCIYIQSMFMNLFLGEMDGMKLAWSHHLLWGTFNIVIWIIIASIPFFTKMLFRSYKFLITTVAASFLALEVVSAGSLVITAPESVWKRDGTCYVDGANLFQFSKNKNIIVFIFDALGSGYLDWCFNDAPETKSVLKDFIWYTDARSNYAQSFPGIPHELTGALIHPAINRKEMLRQLWNSESAKTFYNQIKKAGFDSRLFINDKHDLGTQDIYASYYSNIVEGDIEYIVDSQKLYPFLIQLSLFSAVPYALKDYFFYSNDSYNDIVTIRILANNDTEATKIISKPNPVKELDDNVGFYATMMKSGITTDADSPVLAFYYTTGVHSPWVINEKCKHVDKPFDSPLPTIKSCIFIISEFIRLLKDNQIYDNTAILICSDHGAHGLIHNTPYDMSFILKPFNRTSSSIVLDKSKVQSIDIVPLLLQLACGDKSDYTAFEGFPPSRVPVDRERTVRLLSKHPDIPGFRGINGKTFYSYNCIKEFSFTDANSFMQRDFEPVVQADGANEVFLRYVPLSSDATVDEKILSKPRAWNQ